MKAKRLPSPPIGMKPVTMEYARRVKAKYAPRAPREDEILLELARPQDLESNTFVSYAPGDYLGNYVVTAVGTPLTLKYDYSTERVQYVTVRPSTPNDHEAMRSELEARALRDKNLSTRFFDMPSNEERMAATEFRKGTPTTPSEIGTLPRDSVRLAERNGRIALIAPKNANIDAQAAKLGGKREFFLDKPTGRTGEFWTFDMSARSAVEAITQGLQDKGFALKPDLKDTSLQARKPYTPRNKEFTESDLSRIERAVSPRLRDSPFRPRRSRGF